MLIKYIKTKNYKTYKDLNLNLEVKDGKSIILIGGKNMCGKTTLFSAINGALYGLKIKDERDFKSQVNWSYGKNDEWKNQEIVLEIMFTGYVLGQLKNYKLRRLYKLIDGKPVENVRLDFDSTTYSFGTHTPLSDRKLNEEGVNRIIKANLPKELSDYFLFDALQVGNLVEQSKIDSLIKDNIRSVMGFNKFQILKEASQRLLEERNAERLNNSQLREEYLGLLSTQKRLKEELENLKEEKSDALAYSTEKNEEYKQLLQGKQSDEGLKEKIRKANETINIIINDEKGYNQKIKDFTTTLERDVFIPKIVSVIADEANEIIAQKNDVNEKKKGLLTDKQIELVTHQILDIINKNYGGNGSINAEFVANKVKELQAEKFSIVDGYSYLDDADIKLLKELTETRYANAFIALDRERTSLNQRVEDLPKLRDNVEDYRAQLAGDDYSVIKKYEDNESRLKQLKLDIVAKERELKQTETKLESFDVQDNDSNDITYDTLKKLPELFDTLSERLLASRKGVIEQNMKSQLNKLILELNDVIDRVELNINKGEISLQIYHVNGNEIILDGLSAAGKQILMQVLLKELRDNGDYDPPVMIDSVMGNFDSDSKNAVLKDYFPYVATQTILFSNNIEITPDENGYGKLRPFISKSYLLERDRYAQCTNIVEGYFDGYK